LGRKCSLIFSVGGDWEVEIVFLVLIYPVDYLESDLAALVDVYYGVLVYCVSVADWLPIYVCAVNLEKRVAVRCRIGISPNC